ncbi:MAG: hypothetical protein MUF68_03930 [Cyclobacteriaceae bacterium]|jgi:tetratricopeptide (TPR) repeat protein|nr:hypothetical protein [Cyclobacteriaceae bacterium]
MPKIFTYLLLGFFALALQPSFSQGNTTKRLDAANKLYARQEYNQALAIYFKLLEENPNDAKVLLKIGLCYLSSAPKFQSLTYLDRAYKINPDVDADIHYYLGLSNQLNFNFKKAGKNFELYKERNKRMRDLCDHKIEECKRGDSLMNKSVNAIVKVMEWPVNSVYEDYAPLLNDNEDLLVFTSARDSGFYDRRNKVLFEEIMIARKKTDNTWSTPKKISPNINKE